MKNSIMTESLPAKDFLVIKGFVELDGKTDSYEDTKQKILSWLNDGSIDRIKKASGQNKIYTIFCHSCELDESTGAYICSFDLACENNNNIKAGNGFDTIHLEPSEYVVFDYYFDKEMTMIQALKTIDDTYWGEWLEKNQYESMIETTTGANTPGIATIGLIEPLDPNAERFHIKNCYPIRVKK